MKKRMKCLLRKCKTLSRQLSRSSSYSSLARDPDYYEQVEEEESEETIFVGKSRRRYVISSKYLNHPLLSAIIQKSKMEKTDPTVLRCEVVLFDHLLWMLQNADPNNLTSDSFEDLAQLYVY